MFDLLLSCSLGIARFVLDESANVYVFPVPRSDKGEGASRPAIKNFWVYSWFRIHVQHGFGYPEEEEEELGWSGHGSFSTIRLNCKPCQIQWLCLQPRFQVKIHTNS